MLYLTVLFIILYGYTLLFGNFLAKPLNELSSVIIKIKELENSGVVLTKAEKDALSRKSLISVVLSIFPAILIIITELIYFTTAIPIDPFKYPSIFMLTFVILNFFYAKKITKKADLKTEEGIEEYKNNFKIKRYTIRGWLISLIKLIYFLYMFWVLSFGIGMYY